MTIYYHDDDTYITAFIGDDDGKTCLIRVHSGGTGMNWGDLYLPHKGSHFSFDIPIRWPEDHGGTLRERFRIALQEATKEPGIKKLGVTRLLRAFI